MNSPSLPVSCWAKWYLTVFACLAFSLHAVSQPGKVSFHGMLTTWGIYNVRDQTHFNAGIRYIPSFYAMRKAGQNIKCDLEASIKLDYAFNTNFKDTAYHRLSLAPYRFWGRISGDRFEVRMGLQKINFGSASLIRPLMWFDQTDPRDPLKLTSGVWGLLMRYYTPENTNFWLWCLIGNNDERLWDLGKTRKNTPELGGRIQAPWLSGEVAASYHYRLADMRSVNIWHITPEHRFGFDGKWDAGVGLWVEGAWFYKPRFAGEYTHQRHVCIGVDYTFPAGKGIYCLAEQFVGSYSENFLSTIQTLPLTGLSVQIPFGLTGQAGTMLFIENNNGLVFSYLTLKTQVKSLIIHLIVFLNPENGILLKSSETGNLFSGKGLHALTAWYH